MNFGKEFIIETTHGGVVVGFQKLLGLVLLLACAGCASTQQKIKEHKVKPWEKGNFTKPGMSWSSPGFEASIRDHIYFSKEASSGRAAAGGGGCGCN